MNSSRMDTTQKADPALQDRNKSTNMRISSNNNRRSSTSEGHLDNYCHHRYLSSILNNWSGEPKELFNLQNWKRWIRQEAGKDGLDKFRRKGELSRWVSALMGLCFDENQPHFNLVQEKFNQSQREQFVVLKKEFDDKEVEELLEQTGNMSDKHFRDVYSDEDFLSGEEDEVCRPSDSSSEEHVLRLGPAIKLYSNVTDELKLFQEHPAELSTAARKSQPYMKKTQRKGSLGSHHNRAEKKRNSDSSFDKQKYAPLPIKIRRNEIKRSATPNRGKAIKHISDVLNTTFEIDGDEDEYSDSRLANDRFKRTEYTVYENPTPPCSPICDVEEASNDHHSKSKQSITKESMPLTITPTKSNSPMLRKPSTSADRCGFCYKKMVLVIFGTSRRSECPRCCSVMRNHKRKGQGKPWSDEKENTPRVNLFGNVKQQSSRVSPSAYEPFTLNTSNKTAYAREEAEDTITMDPESNSPIFLAEKENFPLSNEEILANYPRPDFTPPLTLEIFEEIQKTLQKPAKEKVVSGFGLNVLREDLDILTDNKQWLIDVNIDFYLELIRERSKESGYPRVYIFHSFFYTLLTEEDGGYAAVEDATGDEDIFKYDYLFIPIHLSQHWRLVVAFVNEKRLVCFDSMSHNNDEVVKNVSKFLRAEKMRKQRKKYENNVDESESAESNSDGDDDSAYLNNNTSMNGWSNDQNAAQGIPQQTNAIDCGIFVLQYAEYLSREHDFDFNQSHIRYFRKRMVYETITKKLLTGL